MSTNELSIGQISDFSNQLKNNQAELLTQLELSKENTGPVTLDQQSVGRVSRIDAIQQQQMSIASRDQSKLLLRQIEAALQRIEADVYGLCIQCDESIGFARLQAQPHTPNCLACQSALEES